MRKNELIKTGLYFILAALLLTAVCIVVYTSMRSGWRTDSQPSDQVREQAQVTEDETELLQQVSSTSHPGTNETDQISAQGDDITKPASDETTYKLVVTDGCLQVYVAETGTLYMETAIAYDLLPERVQMQIDEGKYFESEEALLEFLENYSS